MHRRRFGRSATIRFAAIVLVAGLTIAPAWADQRVALVVGNSAYQHVPPLATPVHDAADVAAALERLGFAVMRVDDADQGSLRRSLRTFATQAAAAETAVAFYAGHGFTVDGRNFLVPVDALLASSQDAEFEAVPLALMERAVGRASGLRLIILDACRESPFAASLPTGQASEEHRRGLAPAEPAAGTLVAYAARDGSLAIDAYGRNSHYTRALLRHLEEPALTVMEMLQKVRGTVLATTAGSQEPAVYGSLLAGAPALEPNGKASAEAPGSPLSGSAPHDDELTAERLAAERLYWESVAESGDPTEIQAYLDQYPDGIYVALALARLERLRRASEAATPDAVTPPRDQASGERRTGTVVEPENPGSESEPREVEDALGLSRDHRRQIQLALAHLGFDPGAADGIFGQRTRAAIGRWQASEGKSPTGYLDTESAKLLARRGVVTAPAVGQGQESDPSRMSQRRRHEEAGKLLSKALQLAGEVDDHEERAEALAAIADALAAMGDIARARRTLDLALASAERIEDDFDLLSVRVAIAGAQAAVGDIDKAYATASRAVHEEFDWRDSGFRRIALAQAAAGDISGARATADRFTEEDDRAVVLSAVAAAQMGAGDAAGAMQSFADAWTLANRIADARKRGSALLGIVNSRARAGDVEGASAVARQIVDDGSRAAALVRIAWASAEIRTGDPVRVETLAEEALAIARLIQRDDDRDSVLHQIADVQALSGNITKATATAREIKDEGDRAHALESATFWHTYGQALAGETDAGGVSAAFQHGEGLDRDVTYLFLAEGFAQAGDARSALALSELIEDESYRITTLVNSAQILVDDSLR